MKKRVFFILVVFILSSCNRSNIRETLLPNVTGKAGEVVLVIEKGWWEGAIGDSVRSFFLQEHTALPQSEPIVDLVNIPSQAFTDIFKTHRNIIHTYISKSVLEPQVFIKRDFEAKPQIYVKLEAPDEKSFMDLFMSNRERILASILKIERERIINTYKKYPERGISNYLLSHYNIGLVMPRGYRERIEEENFLWYSYETQLTSQGVFIYFEEYTDTAQFQLQSLIERRNELLKKYVPGPAEGSYMTTETYIPVERKEFSFNGNYGVELRGLWKLEKDFMGGPFISVTTIDQERNRIVTIEGYVYAPKFDKRNYLRQMEALIYTLEFPSLKEEV